MKKSIALSFWCVVSLYAADGLDGWFKEGSIHGNIKYYYIDTAKEGGNQATASQHSNSIGGQLGYITGSLYGLKLGTTFMTTNPFALPEGDANVEQSTLARDNRAKSGIVADGNKGFSVLGEAYGLYNRDNYELWYGRKVIESPLIDAKESRILPSSVEGAIGTVKLTSAIQFSAGFIDKFKQRTSDRFYDIIEHALGSNTQAITGKTSGYVVPLSLRYKNGAYNANIYDYYTPDFMNSVYADGTFANKLDADWSYSAAIQGISQTSIGNANSDAAKAIMGGEIRSEVIAAKISATYQDTTILVAYSHVFSHEGAHDSLVLPWDGTPLYTNMLTSNNLFVSDYGHGLESDTAYIGGTTGVKIGILEKLDFTGIKGMTAGLSYAHYDGSRFIGGAQEDINGELGYGAGNLSLALKGMWVSHNTAMGNDPHSTAKVNDDLTQYRIIANYKF